MKKYIPAGFMLIAFALTGCESAEQAADSGPEPTLTDDVVAIWGDESVSVEEFESWIFQLPATMRPVAGEDLLAWQKKQVRELLVQRWLRDQHPTMESGTSSDTTAVQYAQTLSLRQCLPTTHPDLLNIRDEDIEARYQEHLDNFQLPERRLVSHIFLQQSSDADIKSLKESANALRDQVLNGANFGVLAQEHSDSQSAMQRGSLGWLQQESVSTDLAQVVFGLQEFVPSEPVQTRDGIHLFMVSDILPARTIGVKEAQSELRKRILQDRTKEALQDLVSRLDEDEVDALLDRDAFLKVLAENDKDFVLLSLEGREVSLAELLLHAPPEGPVAARNPELLYSILEAQWLRYYATQYCRNNEHVDVTMIDQALQKWHESQHLQRNLLAQLHQHVAANQTRLETYFANNAGSFSQPPSWSFQCLVVPDTDDSTGIMRELEAAKMQDELDLDALADRLGGTLTVHHDMLQKDIVRMSQQLAIRLSSGNAGDILPPFRDQRGLNLVRVTHIEASRPVSFESVVDKVVRAYVNEHQSEVYLSWQQALFEDPKLVFHEQVLAGILTPEESEDVLIDEIEQALERISNAQD